MVVSSSNQYMLSMASKCTVVKVWGANKNENRGFRNVAFSCCSAE